MAEGAVCADWFGWSMRKNTPPANTSKGSGTFSGPHARRRVTGCLSFDWRRGVMDDRVHSLSASWCVRRLFAIACTTGQPRPARPAGGVGACVGKELSSILRGGGEVTPTPPYRLPATYSWADPMRMNADFWEGHRA
jgi:hypothetical protein